MHALTYPGAIPWPTIRARLRRERGIRRLRSTVDATRAFLINATVAMLLCVIGVLTASITLGLVLSS